MTRRSVAKLNPDYVTCDNLEGGPPADLHGAEGALHDDYFVVCGGMTGGAGSETAV